MNGFIQLHRKLLYNPIFQNEKLLKLFIYCLLKASYKDRETMIGDSIVTLSCGQFVTGRKALARDLDLSEQQVRTLISKLERLNILHTKATNKYTLVTVINWGLYQNPTSQSTNEQPTINQPSTTNNKVNKDNKVNKFSFKNELIGLGVEESIVDDWLTVRKKKRASNTETAFKGLINQIEKTSLSTNEAIKLCVENTWSGFKADYVKDETSNIPYEKIMELFNKHCPALKTCFDLTATRKRGIAEIWNADTRHQDGKFWIKYLSTINSSADITNQWENSADYAFNYKTFVKLMEATC